MHIPLHRSFHELAQPKGPEADDIPLALSGTSRLNWDQLLERFRVVILSEAGSGKTEEIRQAARRLRAQGKHAFFLRLEHVALDLESAFEEGTFEEFEAWIRSTEEGWLLLDSIDESRLKDPQDFERAIRRVARSLSTAKQRAHLILTGRTVAWRPVTDKRLCEALFPYSSARVAAAKAGSNFDVEVETRNLDSTDAPQTIAIVALDDLSRAQVETFAKGKGVKNLREFLDAIDRADAWSFTTRPQDLQELTEFWTDTGRIGTRFELMQNSVAHRLQERDQTRDEARPLAPERARQGARIIAAAATLTQHQAIAVPDGSESSKGLRIDSLLPEWNAVDRGTLLLRPLFDEEVYGSVRFYHRSVREYLAAEWFAELLQGGTSIRNVERVFFQCQHGIEVVPPSLKPVLSWLLALDATFLERARRVAPEVVFEDGDPSRLPVDFRRQVLTETCSTIASGAIRWSTTDSSALQRFGMPDLSKDVISLIEAYKNSGNVVAFLLRMAWHGRLVGVLPKALEIAMSTKHIVLSRVSAFRVVSSLGTQDDMRQLRASFASESVPLNRDLLAELVEELEPNKDGIDWLFGCLPRVANAVVHRHDDLADEVDAFISRAADSNLCDLIERMASLLRSPPFIERRHCEVSKHFQWLLRPAGNAVKRLLLDGKSLESSALAVLRLLPIAGQYIDSGFDHSDLELVPLLAQRADVRWSLFWHTLDEERRWLASKKNERITDWWRAMGWPSYVTFTKDDFPSALEHVVRGGRDKPHPDDGLVALSLAFNLYVEGGRLAAQRKLLKDATKQSDALKARLQELLHPPRQSADTLRYKRQSAAWKRQATRQQQQREKNRQEWRRHLRENVATLSNPGLKEPTAITNGQYYLLECMREAGKNDSRWTEGNWRSLEPEFGREVAEAFRDGAINYWRRHLPELRSEGATPNSTPIRTIFGLAGLAIEAREVPNWVGGLSEEQVAKAFRYATHELNGFPAWFSRLFASHREKVCDLLMREMAFEISNSAETGPGSQYLLHDVAWSGEWLFDDLSPKLLQLLKEKEPANATDLRYLLQIVQSSAISDAEIKALAEAKSRTSSAPDHRSQWLAAWTGVDPVHAIPAAEKYVQRLPERGDQTKLAMMYLTALLGGRRSQGTKVRDAFRLPEHLKRLYLFVNRYVRPADDIDRANQGVYSPGLRDDAQDAREQLLHLLTIAPGKEAFVALKDVAENHPDKEARAWLRLKLKAKAESEVGNERWTDRQVREFQQSLERTPTNHRELFELAVLRLLDLKGSLEDGDSSIASMLVGVDQEVEIRKYIGGWCRDSARGRYSIPQEEELADAKRPDLRWLGNGFDAPVPTELKLADNWSGPQLFERLEVQLCGDYLRDSRSRRGIYVLVYRGAAAHWQLPAQKTRVDFGALVQALEERWKSMCDSFPEVDDIQVIGIDLTMRSAPKSTVN